MTYVGIDHGTTAIRVAAMEGDDPSDAGTYEILKSAGEIDFMSTLAQRTDLDAIDMIGVSYSMGDAISSITPLDHLEDRGVQSLEGIGPMTGIGTRMFDDVRDSGLPAVALPGLHRGCPWLDRRFTIIQSHVASPKKVAATVHCILALSRRLERGVTDAVVANVSSNTVTLLVKNGRIRGGIDACIGAPGLRHGPLDVDSIRRVDAGEITANEAFSTRGVMAPPFDTPERIMDRIERDEPGARTRMEALLMAVSMEISGMVTVAGGIEAVCVTGALGEIETPVDIGAGISRNIGRDVEVFSRFSAAKGAAEMARMVHEGATQIFGIPVEGSGDGQ